MTVNRSISTSDCKAKNAVDRRVGFCRSIDPVWSNVLITRLPSLWPWVPSKKNWDHLEKLASLWSRPNHFYIQLKQAPKKMGRIGGGRRGRNAIPKDQVRKHHVSLDSVWPLQQIYVMKLRQKEDCLKIFYLFRHLFSCRVSFSLAICLN